MEDKHPSSLSTELGQRSSLPLEYRYLLEQFPRSEWRTARAHAMARAILQRHAWFRNMQRHINGLAAEWRAGKSSALMYRGYSIPLLQEYVPSLRGHHSMETHQVFPALLALEPAMARGFELLDSDHDVIDRKLSNMVQVANQLIIERADPLVERIAYKLADAFTHLTSLLEQHLSDEEEIVVPTLSLRGYPLGLST